MTNYQPARVHIRLSDFQIGLIASGQTVTPYVWTAFFKIDGDTVTVGLAVQGTATVVGNQSDWGNVTPTLKSTPLGVVYDIASDVGNFVTVLKEIPVPIAKTNFPGIVGYVAVLINQAGSTPAQAVAAGHSAFNSSLQTQLNGLIASVGPMTTINQSTINTITNNVQQAVTNAVIGALNLWQEIVLAFGTPDTVIQTYSQIFNQSALLASPPQGITILKTIDVHGGRFKGDTSGKGPIISTWTLDGRVVADPVPLSMKRILTGMGTPPPISLSGNGSTGSLEKWIADHR